jgi:hypothetical protein
VGSKGSTDPELAIWIAVEGGVSPSLFGDKCGRTLCRYSGTARVPVSRADHGDVHALSTASKGTSSIADYFAKMKGLADEMA